MESMNMNLRLVNDRSVLNLGQSPPVPRPTASAEHPTQPQIPIHEPTAAKGNPGLRRMKPLLQTSIKPGYTAIRAAWRRRAQAMLSSLR